MLISGAGLDFISPSRPFSLMEERRPVFLRRAAGMTPERRRCYALRQAGGGILNNNVRGFA